MQQNADSELTVEVAHVPPGFRWVIRNLLIDKVTAEVSRAFAAEHVETLVLKGPALAMWLYPGTIRAYCDSDLMVAPEGWLDAVGILETLGFAQYRSWMPDPLSLDRGGTAFARDASMVDLHCVLPGLDGDPAAIWASLLSNAVCQVIGGTALRVPDHYSLLLHVALHAAHHANYAESKAVYDLRRAIACANEQQWRGALELARIYEGVPAFVAGLRLPLAIITSASQQAWTRGCLLLAAVLDACPGFSGDPRLVACTTRSSIMTCAVKFVILT